jgi:hypothetical protein
MASLMGPLAALPAASRADMGAAAFLAVFGAFATWIGFQHLGLPIQHYATWDFWFESDPRRVVALADDRLSYHHHSTSHHPLFSLAMFPPVFGFKALGVELDTAIGVVLSLVTAIWIALTYLVLRLFGLRLVEAVAFAALTGATASVIFWFPVPETFSFGAMTIIAVIALSAVIERSGGNAPLWVYVFAGVLAISMTTTNWLAALAMFLVFLGWGRGALAAIASMVVTLALWAVEHTLFPEADTFLNVFRGSEVDYVFNEEALGVGAKLIGFFFHSIVMPDIAEAYGYRMTVQGALPGEGDLLSLTGIIGWSVMFALGVWGIVRRLGSTPTAGADSFGMPKTALVLLLTLAGQLAVTILFGIETFLYSAHFGPLLVLVAAFAVLTPAARLGVPLAIALAVVAGYNNVQQFAFAASQTKDRFDQRVAFLGVFERIVGPGDLVVCGMPALAGAGEAHVKRDGLRADVGSINQLDNPDTCLYSVDGQVNPAQGWLLWYEDWSAQTIDEFARRGARFFVTSYTYGLEDSRAMFEDLGSRYREIERTSQWAFYDLQAQPVPAADSR